MEENVTELCELAYKYGADKCFKIGHQYTPFYYELFKDRRNEIKKVLEIGVGNLRQYKHIVNYHLGASLYMWRDFFPNAQIYGIDIDPTSVFDDGRVKTFLGDAGKKEDLENIIKEIGTDIDIVVDDGSHHFDDQRDALETLMPILDKKVTYIIEDCRRVRRLSVEHLQWDSFIPVLLPNDKPRIKDGIVVFTHKK